MTQNGWSPVTCSVCGAAGATHPGWENDVLCDDCRTMMPAVDSHDGAECSCPVEDQCPACTVVDLSAPHGKLTQLASYATHPVVWCVVGGLVYGLLMSLLGAV